MKGYNKSLLLSAAFVLIFSLTGNAQTKEENPFSGIKTNFFFSSGYTYNFNNPADMKNSLRVFDFDHNSFKADGAMISFHQDTSKDQPFGFRSDVFAGSSIPKTIHSSGLTSSDLDITQLYVTYIVPIGNGIKVDFGKFVTFLGYEVIEGWENYNDNYSHSFSFGYSIPYAHTGFRMNYAFSEKAGLSLFLVNGWDNAVENNKSKSIGVQLSLIPAEGLNIYLNAMTGPEQNQNDSDNREIIDLAAIYTSGNLSLGINTNYAKENRTNQSLSAAEWSSFVGYAKYSFSSLFSIALRGELFKDSDGYRTGAIQSLNGLTITPSFNVNEHIVIRGELRYDSSDKEVFTRENSNSKNQFTTSFNFIYHF